MLTFYSGIYPILYRWGRDLDHQGIRWSMAGGVFGNQRAIRKGPWGSQGEELWGQLWNVEEENGGNFWDQRKYGPKSP